MLTCAGELSLDVPDYVKLERNEEDKTALLSVDNVDEKGQAEMWGKQYLPWLQPENNKSSSDGKT